MTILARALRASRRFRLEPVIPSLLAVTVLAFASGSSSIASVTRAGHSARWVVLGMLLVAAGARAWSLRPIALAPAPVITAAFLVAVAVASAGWSVSPRLSVERGISLGVLFAAAVLLTAGERHPWRMLAGLVAGAAAVAIAGLLVLAVDHSAAVQAASIESPARYRGFGQDANTAGLLFAIALAPALGLVLQRRKTRERIGWAAMCALFAGSIVASGSRGALFAGGAGMLVVAALALARIRPRVIAVAAVVAATALGLVVQNVPKALSSSPPTASPRPAAIVGPPPRKGYLNAEAVYPLDADVGGPLPGGGQPPLTRHFFGGSGRSAAWIGTLHQILQRPFLGFGFGTEGTVFVDRYYYFVGGSPEDSYLGISLQLGVVGLVALLALFASALASVPRILSGPSRVVVASCAGAVVAGLTLAIVQSYVYSVGNVGTATLWICAFLLAALGVEARRA